MPIGKSDSANSEFCTSEPLPRKKPYWRLWLTLAGLVLLVVFHAPLLRQIASWLIVNQSIEHCETLFVYNGDRNYSIAAELFQQKKADRIALLKAPMRPLIEFQIILPAEVIVRREIVRQGVPEEFVFFASGEVRDLWDLSDRLKEHLSQHPR